MFIILLPIIGNNAITGTRVSTTILITMQEFILGPLTNVVHETSEYRVKNTYPSTIATRHLPPNEIRYVTKITNGKQDLFVSRKGEHLSSARTYHINPEQFNYSELPWKDNLGYSFNEGKVVIDEYTAIFIHVKE